VKNCYTTLYTAYVRRKHAQHEDVKFHNEGHWYSVNRSTNYQVPYYVILCVLRLFLSLRPRYSLKQFLLVHSQFTFQCKFEERSFVKSECRYPRNEAENVDTDQKHIHFRRTRG